MKFQAHFNDAQRLADSIADWENDVFSWQKAYIAAVFAAVAYEEIPQFELKKSKRAKIIPCDSFQAHVASWETEQRRATLRSLDTNIQMEIIVRAGIVITISRLQKVIFVSFRGTTISFADFKADLDFRKTKYQAGLGETMRLHHGFLDAVLECYDEVMQRLRQMNGNPHVPVYVTGHSLGGAMAAIFHGKLACENDHHFGPRRRRHIPPATACYTFGMPRIGDTSAKAIFLPPYHIYNELDAIPTLPPRLLGFADSPNEQCLNAIPDVIVGHKKSDFALSKGRIIPSILGLSDHRMERYVERTDAMRHRMP